MNKLLLTLGFVLIPLLVIFALFMTHSVETQITLMCVALVTTIIIGFKAEAFKYDYTTFLFIQCLSLDYLGQQNLHKNN
ncbi:hypothetical protein NUD23_002727 [Listeria monocytogenes]|uniref:hypothetical protein n=1 Tax=Listeria innocua TaxID=1642 RepID=UPI00165EA2B1|nr:hypothetical protein [Listeria innocua]EJO8710374.1 hypothetical protein [Listeria monocytogenes]EJQ6454895.1 hypothetical protein [Listeria monocytogenes]EJR7071902.1 hypothetical protein [Listeria monocytogenes]UVW23992.1 hypothetical protein NVV71_00165 [Listeria innocua]HDI4651635.1 hypothetical protein [Listeria monocytogenes]